MKDYVKRMFLKKIVTLSDDETLSNSSWFSTALMLKQWSIKNRLIP